MLINSIWDRKNCLISGKSILLLSVRKKSDNYRGISLLSTSYKTLSNILSSKLSPYVGKTVVIIRVGSDIRDQTLISIFVFVRYRRNNGSTIIQDISYSYTSRKPMIQL
jgi:hypothetical protein